MAHLDKDAAGRLLEHVSDRVPRQMTIRTACRPTEPGLQADVLSLPWIPTICGRLIAFRSSPVENHHVSLPSLTHRLAIVLGLCTLACTPRTAPPPSSPRPAPESAPPTVPLPTTAAPARGFHYAGGDHHYVFTSDATVSVQTDSIRPPLESQTTTRALYSFSIDTLTRPPRITGVIDSFTVRHGSRIPTTTDSTLQFPLRWTSTLGTGSPPQQGCSLSTELIAGAQDLLPRLPTNLEDGRQWREEITRLVCRAEIPVTISSVHEYRVVGPTVFENDTVLQITRTTTATLEGERKQDDKTISLEGTGSGTAQLYVDPAAGQLIGRTEQARTELAIETPRGRTRLSQDVRTQLSRQREQ